jgi:hypothetical protein
VVRDSGKPNWLERSGHSWKARLSSVALQWGTILAVLPLVGASLFLPRQSPHWLGSAVLLSALSGLGLGLVALVLRSLVRCRVCGLRLPSSSRARDLGAEKWRWIDSLDACPVCGDDGRARDESRKGWVSSGAVGEVPYWSSGRVVIAVLITAAIVIGCITWAETWGKARALRGLQVMH